jgi:muramoyltetrapeptide carboxypeptidase LdcA involved in peptidoglycan recycling
MCTPSPTIKNKKKFYKKNFIKKFLEKNFKKIKKISKNKILEKIFIVKHNSKGKIMAGGLLSLVLIKYRLYIVRR